MVKIMEIAMVLLYIVVMQDYNYGKLYKATPCTTYIAPNGCLTQKETDQSTNMYMLETTQVNDKYE